MALSANSVVPPLRHVSRTAKLLVYKNQHIYVGSMVGLTPSGYAKTFEPGDKFAGISQDEYYNNSSTDGAASVAGDVATIRGRTYITVVTGGECQVTLSNLTEEDLDTPTFATSDSAWAQLGHPDAYTGMIVEIEQGSTTKAWVKLPEADEVAPNGIGSYVAESRFAGDFAASGAASASIYVGGFTCKSILGTGLTAVAAADGGITGTFDAVAEVALNSIRQAIASFPVNKGVTFEASFVVSDKGDVAGTAPDGLDFDWGLGTALTANSEANIDHADMVNLACFHMDGNGDSIFAQSDNNTTDVASVDTTIDNDSTTDVAKSFKIIVRISGAVEFWIDGARVLSTTTFAVADTAKLAGFVNMEKSSDDTTAAFILYRLRVAGSRTAA